MSKQPYRIRQRGKAWQTDFFVGGKRIRRTFASKEDAESWVTTQKSDFIRYGEIKAVRPKTSPTLEAISAMMLDDLERAGRSPRTLQDYAERLAKHVIPVLGPLPVHEIKKSHVIELLAKMHTAGNSPHERNRIIIVVKRTLQWAAEHDHIEANPASTLKRVNAPPTREPVYYDEDQQDEILAQLRGKHHGLILTAFRTGMRRRELMSFGMEWVDFERDLIHVPYTVDFKPKGKRRRSIPLAPDLREWLVSLGRSSGPVFASRPRKDVTDGKLLRYFKNPHKMVAQIQEKLGIPLRLHDCRHSFASTMLARGVPLEQVQAVMGHRHLTTTQIYLHLKPDYLEDVRAALMWHKCGTRAEVGVSSGGGKRRPENGSESEGEVLVPQPGIEPGTHGFSVRCSTD